MEKVPMTAKGFSALDKEFKNLKSVERPAVIRAIAEAREHGDLSENAEYHAAREKQSFIEGRLKEIEGLLSRAEIIDPTKLSGAIKFGATVKLVDEDTGWHREFYEGWTGVWFWTETGAEKYDTVGGPVKDGEILPGVTWSPKGTFGSGRNFKVKL